MQGVGGIAWVLDEDGALESRINSGLVRVHEVTPEQAGELRNLLELHLKKTGSVKAKGILEDYEQWLPRFKAVISDEYLDYLGRCD